MIEVWVSQGDFLGILKKIPNHKWKHNVSLILWHEVNTKTLDYLMFDNKWEPFYGYEVDVLTKPSVDGQKNDLNLTLNSMNIFLLSLVISCVGSRFKILRMYWYKCMKTFRDSLELVINKYFVKFFIIHSLVLTIFQTNKCWV